VGVLASVVASGEPSGVVDGELSTAASGVSASSVGRRASAASASGGGSASGEAASGGDESDTEASPMAGAPELGAPEEPQPEPARMRKSEATMTRVKRRSCGGSAKGSEKGGRAEQSLMGGGDLKRRFVAEKREGGRQDALDMRPGTSVRSRLMPEWFYKATNAKVDHVGTLLLANRGFLCRSAYTKAKNWVANVQSVDFGDVIHFYFIGRNPAPLGAFEIVRREDFENAKGTPTGNNFVGPVPGTALYEVVDPAFIKELDPDGGYAPDPELGTYTGWLLRKTSVAAPAPAKFLSETPTLVRR
jgi:hypothetical protein